MGWIEESGRMGWDDDSAVGTEIDAVVAGKSVDMDVSSLRVELPLAEIPASKGVPSDSVGVEDMGEVPACRDVPDGVG